MSIEQYQKNVNSFDKDIATLEKKKTDIDKKCADIQSKIISIQKSITAHTSSTVASSKIKQITGLQADYSKKLSESVAISKKIADVRSKRNGAYLKFQKAQQSEEKKREREAKKLQESYEQRIFELSHSIIPNRITMKKKTTNIAKSDECDVFVSHAWEDKESFVDDFLNHYVV